MLPDQTSDGVDRNVNRATRLLRTFATLTECLRTHRGGGHGFRQKTFLQLFQPEDSGNSSVTENLGSARTSTHPARPCVSNCHPLPIRRAVIRSGL
jgi:hypothetical protein